MRSSLECLPCLVRQAMEAARHAARDEAEMEALLRKIMARLSRMDFREPPPAVAQGIHRIIRRRTGVADPYREAKMRFNAMALEFLPSFEKIIEASADPFTAALCLAVAGNVIDLGAKGDLTEREAFDAVKQALEEPLAGDLEGFRATALSAASILYLADNAGEIVFDAPLLRVLPEARVTVAVRGKPVINDAVMDDAMAAGIADIVPVIENGSDAPGTILRDCSMAFRKAFRGADLIIAKGQGNYETLCDEDAPLWFLFKVKCATIAGHCGLEIGTHAVIQSGPR
ncbi:MAG: DUF89 family protein [Chrysiogenales bacterium]|nr:MAG: DUF89 family protein [Chrysiogenales bacterium]